MSEHTPITGELREAVEWEPTFCGPDKAMVPQPEFDRICDAIDAVHAGLERENVELRERLAALDESADSMHDGWVRLPLDADGVPIHVGDVVIESLPFGGESKPLVVDRMELGRYDGKDVWAVALDTDKSPWVQPPLLRHHHEPTVEDVLREFGRGWHEQMNGPETFDIADYVERFAAKLRLAGSDAE